jgi:hypothetical protein
VPHREAYEALGGQYLINQRGERTPQRDALNRERSRIRARGEHPFHVVTVVWGSTKVRYRGLYKNTVRAGYASRSRISSARANSCARWARSVGVNADRGRKRPR